MTDLAISDPLVVAFFSEILSVEQLARNRLSKALPKGMEISHFSVLNHLAHIKGERTPAQLARALHVTKGAMTNTLGKLEWAGHVHIRPDWDDARRKLVAISPSGLRARDVAIAAIAPVISDAGQNLGDERLKAALPVLRELRERLGSESG